MERYEWLLSLLFAPGSDDSVAQPMDTIRIMKSLFLFGQESPKRPEAFYEFQPYLYGPCSFKVYDDLAELKGKGLVEENRPYYRSYRLTQRGIREAKKAWGRLNASTQELLSNTKRSVLSWTFSQLLGHVYQRWPEYAARSMFRPLPGSNP